MVSRSKKSHWYVIRTRPRTEKVVRDFLAQRGIEPFLPVATRTSRWKARTKRTEWPLFAGYCFAKCSLDDQPTVLQSPGALDILGHANGTPAPVPEEDIVALQRILQCGVAFDTTGTPDHGPAVEIIRGPLLGIHGKLVPAADTCRMAIWMTLIQRGIVLEIDPRDVAPVTPVSYREPEPTTPFGTDCSESP